MRGIEGLQAQIAGFRGDSSYYGLMALAEQLGSRARVAAQQEHELAELYRHLDALREGATSAGGPSPTNRRHWMSDVFPTDWG